MIKIRAKSGEWITSLGIGHEKEEELSALIEKCLVSAPYALVSIVGNKGVGKSTLGKLFRRTGIGSFSARQIAVIDDDNMAVDFLFFFRRWYANRCTGIDELAPFFRYCKNKPVRVYIKSNPESRITRADVVLKVSVQEQVRAERLIRRYGPDKGIRVFRDTADYAQDVKIAYRYELSAIIR